MGFNEGFTKKLRNAIGIKQPVARLLLIQIFNYSRNPLPSAYACCYKAVFFLEPFHIVNYLDAELAACATQWMPQGNGAPVYIHNFRVQL